MSKAAAAFRTISEVAEELDIPKHVLRFWELKFPQLKPMKRGGGRRYYRPEDLELLRGIRHLLHADGYTIKGVQKILREQGVDAAKAAAAGKRATMAPVLGDAPRKTRKSKRTTAHTSSKTSPKSKSATKRKSATATKARADGRASSVEITTALERAIKELQLCRDILRAEPMVAAAANKKPRTRARAAR